MFRAARSFPFHKAFSGTNFHYLASLARPIVNVGATRRTPVCTHSHRTASAPRGPPVRAEPRLLHLAAENGLGVAILLSVPSLLYVRATGRMAARLHAAAACARRKRCLPLPSFARTLAWRGACLACRGPPLPGCPAQPPCPAATALPRAQHPAGAGDMGEAGQPVVHADPGLLQAPQGVRADTRGRLASFPQQGH